MTYRLSRKAEEDIISIWLYGAETFGVDQADRYHNQLSEAFKLIALNPELARERDEIPPPVRVHPFGSHLIVYEIDGSTVCVLRIRHHSEDWINDPV